MRILIASDHGGVALKRALLSLPHEWLDLGCPDAASVDYPDYAHDLSQRLPEQATFGILICRSGIGMSIAANRHLHIRAALCRDVESAVLSRQHNDANVLVLGAGFTDELSAKLMVEAFVTSAFEGGRHIARVSKISPGISVRP